MSPTVPPLPDETHQLAQISAWFVLAGVGGAVKYVSAVIRSPERVSNRRFLALLSANVFISSFCGLMGGLLVSTLTADPTWHYLACGLFGYLGTHSLDLTILALQKKIKATVASPDTVIPGLPSVMGGE